MKLLAISVAVIAVIAAGVYIWKKISIYRLESEIERIKIPDDTFDDK